MVAERNDNKRLTVSIITSMILLNNDESDSSISSESENDDHHDICIRDMQILYSILMANKVRGKMIATEKITDYVERVIPNYSNNTFKQHFRVLPASFEVILILIGPALNATDTASSRKPISAEKQLLIALCFMATSDSYRSICVKFGVGKATAFRSVRHVTYALHCIAPRFIQWPAEVADNIIDEFARVCGFPGVIGAIDGTHIKIRAPPTDSASYTQGL
ncbi:putative nuclease HARBI1 [Solenopsis invicta]|uniref:putative nuclease HARBI1 n=1 Tax=Solenopsis invicta TaxID=13686 RepID=UPI00059590EA|nr:putative nuclease HARBI1 [Solenopsis invicta]